LPRFFYRKRNSRDASYALCAIDWSVFQQRLYLGEKQKDPPLFCCISNFLKAFPPQQAQNKHNSLFFGLI
jgi:hypothetical protein